MAIRSINFNKQRSCIKGDISLHEVEIRATGEIGSNPGGSPADTLLATFTTISITPVSFGLVNQTAVDIAQYFSGTFPNDIYVDTTNLEENVLIRYRVTDTCGTSDWVELEVQKSDFIPSAFGSAGLVTGAIPSAPDVQIALSGYKTDADGRRVSLEDNVDTMLFEVYSPRLAAVVASIEFYIGQDLTVDNEGVTYVTGTNNNWFWVGDGFGEHLSSLILDGSLLLQGSITTQFNKRLWAEANSYIGTDLGDEYEFRVIAKEGVGNTTSTQDIAFIPKMFGVTLFEIKMRSEIGEVPPYDSCPNARHWRIVVTDSYRDDLSPANAREFFNEATIETNSSGTGSVWAAASFIPGADDGICCEQGGAGQITTGLRFKLQVPTSYPWVETPPDVFFEQFGRGNAGSAIGDEFVSLLLDSFVHTILNPVSNIMTADGEIRSDGGTRQGDLIEFNVYMGPSAGDDPLLNNALFSLYYEFEASSINQRVPIQYKLGAEGWYNLYMEAVGDSGGTRFINTKQTGLFYHYSF